MQRKIFSLTLLLVTVIFFKTVHAQKPDAPCIPGISFWNLRSSVSVGYVSGRLSIDKLYAPCLPAPGKQSTSNYAYKDFTA